MTQPKKRTPRRRRSAAEPGAGQAEMQAANEELRSAEEQNLMAAAEIAIVFLDREMRILRFTPQAGEIFDVRGADRGRPLADLTHRLGYPELLDDARRVLERWVPVEREVADQGGRWYLTRVLPYRSAQDRIEGVVFTFVDITRRMQAEDDLRQRAATLEERVEERTRQLRERDERVRAMAARLTIAEQEERRRLAEVLHDDLQQQLFAVQVRAKSTAQAIESGDAERAAAYARDVRAWLDDAIARTRQLSVDLNPPVLEEEELGEIVRWLGGSMYDTHGLNVDLRAERPVEVADDEIRLLVLRALRELLFNVVKHAGVDHAVVEIARQEGELAIGVHDAGRGFEVAPAGDAPSGFGLANVRERLGLFGGRLAIRSRPGGGTRVEVRIPMPSALAEGGAESEGEGGAG